MAKGNKHSALREKRKRPVRPKLSSKIRKVRQSDLKRFDSDGSSDEETNAEVLPVKEEIGSVKQLSAERNENDGFYGGVAPSDQLEKEKDDEVEIGSQHEIEDDDEEDDEEKEEEDDEEKEEEQRNDDEEEKEEEKPETDFATAFAKIMHRRIPEDVPGPILAGKRTLLIEKLAEEDTSRKDKKLAIENRKKEREKNHVLPLSYTDTHEKNLIRIATKGVVQLFNAVSKAQKGGLELAAPTKVKSTGAALISELRSGLGKQSSASIGQQGEMAVPTLPENSDKPSWSVLQERFHLGKTSMKQWDAEVDEDVELGHDSEEEYGSDDVGM